MAGVVLTACAALFMVLLGSFTQRPPSQKYNASVSAIVGPRSTSLYWIVPARRMRGSW